jgi:hypothetical protein
MLDVATVIAGIYYDCCVGTISELQRRTLTQAFLDGYGPVESSLRWHVAAALFEERARRAINRIRINGLKKLPELLALATEILNGHLDPIKSHF